MWTAHNIIRNEWLQIKDLKLLSNLFCLVRNAVVWIAAQKFNNKMAEMQKRQHELMTADNEYCFDLSRLISAVGVTSIALSKRRSS